MNITPLNLTQVNHNSVPLKVGNRKQLSSDTFSFTGNKAGMLKRTTVCSLQNIETAYNDIMSHLSRKTDKGLENIERNYGNFSYKKGMVFHDCGKEGTSIAVRIPEGKGFSGLMRIMVRKGNTFFKERIVLASYMIKDCDKLVSDFDKTHLNYFPKEYKLMTPEEIASSGADEKLPKIIEDLDYAMLKFRQYLYKQKDIDIKIPDFIIPYSLLNKLDNIKVLNENITEKLKALPRKVALYVKNNFGDYDLTTGQTNNTMKNLGESNLKMSVSTLNNPQHGELTRLMVFDKNDKPVAGYLINSDGKFVSNFNCEYLSVIPPKFTLLNEKEAETLVPEFKKNITLFEEKLKKFDEYLDEINKQRAQRLEDIETRKAAAALKKESKVYKPEKAAVIKPKKEPKLSQERVSKKTIKEPKRERIPKKTPVTRQKEYRELMKESIARLKNSMAGVNDNLDDFKKTMADIQKRVEDYFESHK